MSNSYTFEAVTSATIGADVVSKTLDTLNSGQLYSGLGGKSGSTGKIGSTYDLSKSVLSAVYEGKGTIVSSKG